MNSVTILFAAVLLVSALLTTGCSSAGSTGITTGAAAVGSDGFVCPLTGETLPCPDCCPLKDAKGGPANTEYASMAAVSSDDTGYICPVTGETLPCELCCPLNKP